MSPPPVRILTDARDRCESTHAHLVIGILRLIEEQTVLMTKTPSTGRTNAQVP